MPRVSLDRFRRLRIRTCLMLLVLVSAAPFVLLTAILVTRTAMTQVDSFGRDVVAVARATSLAIDARLSPVQSALESLGRSPVLARGDLPAFRADLAEAAVLLGSTLILSDASGQELLNTAQPPEAALGKRPPLAHLAGVTSSGRPAVSDIYQTAKSGRFQTSIDVPVAVERTAGDPADAGETPALLILSAAIELSTIQDLFLRQRLPDDWLGGIVDREGRFIGRTRDYEARAGTPSSQLWTQAVRNAPDGWARTVTLEGVVSYVGYVTSPVTGWTVGLSVPYAVVWAPLKTLLLPLLLLGVALTALSVALARLLAHHITRPVAALAGLLHDHDGIADPNTPHACPRNIVDSGIREVDEAAQALLASDAARRAVEAALRDSEAELRAATELSPQRPWTADATGKMLSGSHHVSSATGTATETRLGTGWTSIVHPSDRPAAMAAWAHSVATGQHLDHEFRIRIVDGAWRWFRSRATPRFDANGQVMRWYGTTEDVHARHEAETALRRMTEGLETRVAYEVAAREAAQAQLHQSQRMQALGQLASGIAHDFNNVLQAVQGALALIGKRPNDPARVMRLATMAGDATGRGAAITGRLLSLARRGELRAGLVETAPLLVNLAEVLAHTLGSAIDVRPEAASDLPPLLADRGQLETVLINLAANARDAMPSGGTLLLAAAAERDPEGVPAGAYIRISVVDNGDGMDPATLARASEPFFTTKEVGRGTGLGLAMALGFAEQSGGALRIASVRGAGTTVHLWLPCGADGASPNAVPPVTDAAASARAMAGRRVLLVDDDPLVRATVAEQLAEHGCDIVAVADGTAALTALGSDMTLLLLVTDLTMPGMDGVALIQAAQRLRPALPAILMTGYAGGGASLALGQAIAGPFSLVQKPVSAVQLADRIAGMLEPHASH